MIKNPIRYGAGALLLTVAPLLLAAPAKLPAKGSKTPATVTESTTEGTEKSNGTAPEPAADGDSRQIRQDLNTVLHGYPPEVGMVLKLDPSLFANSTYLATYPALATFVAAHPEVAHSPQFFLQDVTVPTTERLSESRRREFWLHILGGLTAFVVFVIVTCTLAWLVKTLIEQRRWSRQSRVQTEVHSKLLERFTSNEELIAYIQSPAGRRFLEATPIALDVAPSSVSAPVGRFLWSIQIGLVLAAGGFGLQYVSGSMPAEIVQVTFGVGVVILSVGAGFVLSAIVSFILSRRLGLMAPPAIAPVADDQGTRG